MRGMAKEKSKPRFVPDEDDPLFALVEEEVVARPQEGPRVPRVGGPVLSRRRAGGEERGEGLHGRSVASFPGGTGGRAAPAVDAVHLPSKAAVVVSLVRARVRLDVTLVVALRGVRVGIHVGRVAEDLAVFEVDDGVEDCAEEGVGRDRVVERRGRRQEGRSRRSRGREREGGRGRVAREAALAHRAAQLVEGGREGGEDGSRSFLAPELFGADLTEVVIGVGDIEEAYEEPERLAAGALVEGPEGGFEEARVLVRRGDGRRVGQVLDEF